MSAALLIGPCLAREVTDAEMAEIREAVRYVVRDDQILQLDALWGEDRGSATLEVMVTTRPFDVGNGLCVTEGYRFSRNEAEDDFRRINDDGPISNYWIREGSCDVIDPNSVTVFGEVPNAVMVGQLIATAHVAQILRGADDIIRSATPDLRCNERMMTQMFEPGTRLRLSSIRLDIRHAPGVGVQYIAFYTREGLRGDDGVSVRFTMQPEGFAVTFACFWQA